METPQNSACVPARRRTRQHTADAAQRLFHARGFDAVTVADVARVAELGEQTVYNYFSSKEGLVFDEADAFAARFAAMVQNRRHGESFIAALRPRLMHSSIAWELGQPIPTSVDRCPTLSPQVPPCVAAG